MRFATILLVTMGLLSASPAAACFTSDMEKYTFLPALPKTVPDGAVVLLVRAPKDFDPWATTGVIEVQSVLAGEWTSDEVELVFGPYTSCSRREFLVSPSFVVGTPSAIPGRLNALEFRLAALRGVTVLQDGSVKLESFPH